MAVLRKKSDNAQELKEQRDDLELLNQKLMEDLHLLEEKLKAQEDLQQIIDEFEQTFKRQQQAKSSVEQTLQEVQFKLTDQLKVNKELKTQLETKNSEIQSFEAKIARLNEELKTARKSSDFETESDLKLGKFKKETHLLEVVQATKSENMILKAKLEVGAKAKSAEQIKLEAKLREESVNVETLQRMNNIL